MNGKSASQSNQWAATAGHVEASHVEASHADGPYREHAARAWLAPMDAQTRYLVALAAAGAAGLLLLAMLLRPAPEGWGTHEQLGLRPCFTATYLHMPCPFCGMTTAFTHAVRLNLAQAADAQPAGALLAFGMGLSIPILLLSAVSGWGMPKLGALLQSRFAWMGGGLVVALAWLYKLLTFGV